MTEPIGRPAYQQVADDLRDLITRGDFAVGDPIPSTAQLCTRYSVSATVVRAAVSQLRTDGILRGQPGKAVYVVATPEAVEQDEVRLDDVAAGVDDLRQEVSRIGERLDSQAEPDAIAQLREEVAELRRQVGQLQAQLMDLYGRTGHNYPRERTAETKSPGKSRRSTG